MEMNLQNDDRIMAYLIIDGDVYADCDHQACLLMYYEDHNAKNITSDYSATQKELEHLTYVMKNEHIVYGFDLFDTGDGYILLAHDKETYDKNIAWMREYAAKEDTKIGYFVSKYDAIV